MGGALGPLPVLFSTKVSRDIPFQGPQVMTTPASPTPGFVGAGGNGDWHRFPCLWERLPRPQREGSRVGEKWPWILASSFVGPCPPGRLLAVGRALGKKVFCLKTTVITVGRHP